MYKLLKNTSFKVQVVSVSPKSTQAYNMKCQRNDLDSLIYDKQKIQCFLLKYGIYFTFETGFVTKISSMLGHPTLCC